MSANEAGSSSDGGSHQRDPLYLIGVGASAGGLQALEEFFSAVAANDEAAYVVAQHLAPSHPSLLVDLLARSSPLPVAQAQDGVNLRGGVIFVAPPDSDVFVEGDVMRVVEPPERFGSSPSIDRLFESLASNWGDRSAAVVLSGTGSDWAMGLRDVRARGGLTLVQSPETASFPGMPSAAISLGGAELIDSAEMLGARVTQLARAVGGPESLASLNSEALIESLLTRLKATVGIDFDRFKRSTVQRQLNRRMAIRNLREDADYVQLLEGDPDECRAFAGSLLVTVTSFFRDPEAFEALAERVGEYLQVSPHEHVRVWVPGCATGEEVYSLAMLLGEALGFPSDLGRRVKIFGTDLDETSLAIARRGAYPTAALGAIPQRLRDTCTRKSPEGFRIAETLRECTVFAQQDVGHDPPFPQMDIVSCRNTLIYFNESLQRDVLSLFAFSLKSGGLLFLGRAESVSGAAEWFETVDADHRIFVRTDRVALPSLHSARVPSPVKRSSSPSPVAYGSAEEGPAEQVTLLEAILRSTGQSYLVLDPREQLVHVVGDVSEFCQVPQGHLTASAGSFLRPELQAEARALLLLSRPSVDPVLGQYLHLDDGVVLQMSAIPVMLREGTYTVLGLRRVEEPGTEDQPPSHPRSEDFDRELERLDRELQASQGVLRRSLAELQAANQELEATSEELQASMEELQSANEELQASNEELQATNEELAILIQEQRSRADELERVNLDLRNIQASVSQGMVIVDRELRITRFTPMAVRIFALTPGDLGHSLLEIPTSASTPDLDGPLRRVIDEGVGEAFEASSSSGHYLLQTMPYVGGNGQRLGAIVTVTDVSTLVSLRDEAEVALAQLREKSALLTRQATVDAVTEVSNRAYFTTALGREIDRCRRTGEQLALAWVDLDRFKEVNDGFGHAAGDITLQVVAERMHRLVRGTDLVGRLGGDEFGVALAGQGTLEELDGALERIVAAIRDPIPIPDGEVRIAGSVGVAVYPDDASDVEGLLRSADAAMYVVKNRGGDDFAYFDRSMNEAADDRRALRQRIDNGLANNEFLLFFQPVVSTSGDSVWGFEALLRWDNGVDTIAAKDFIPFAESSGQIRRLGAVTMREARRASAALADAGFQDLCMAINMSPTQLEDDALLDQFRAWPTPDGLNGLVVEVTESVFLPEREQALESLRLLTSLGARIAVDDFGSGYSNYRLLETLAPNLIKLDRSFLELSRDAQARRVLMESAIRMAQVMQARVIVEGVETTLDMDLAVAAGADFVQGFAVAEPMPLVDAIAWLDERRSSGRLGTTGC